MKSCYIPTRKERQVALKARKQTVYTQDGISHTRNGIEVKDPPRYTLSGGREIFCDGLPLFSLHKSSRDGGNTYTVSPCEMDDFAHRLVALLNGETAK